MITRTDLQDIENALCKTPNSLRVSVCITYAIVISIFFYYFST